MHYFDLNNGVKMPMVGIGTFLFSPAEAENSVYEALKAGYPMIDTANAYMNERGVGRGIKRSGASREDVFLVTKLWPTEYENGDKAIDDTLARLGTDYIDLLFLHQPVGNYLEGYKALERAYKAGKIKAIGLSNFPEGRLQNVLANCTVLPQVVQVEAHPYYPQNELKEYLKKFGMGLMAWYPLGHGDKSLMEQEVFSRLAKKYGKSNAQIILRWHTQAGNIVIPGAKSKAHIEQNIDLFDFELTAEEMAEIAQLDRNTRYYNMPIEDAEKAYMSLDIDFNDQE